MHLTRIKRLLLGEPRSTETLGDERLSKTKALAILSSDALSSVAYATEEILIPLAAFMTLAISWSLPIALAIAVLLVIVTISYRQTIDAYPGGGGAYSVAKENLGIKFGLIAAASLLIEYILTVSVSVSASVAAITSAWPFLATHKEGIATVIILMLTVVSLRDTRESASIFAIPTYLFIGSMCLLIFSGISKIMTGEIPPSAPLLHEIYPEVPLFLLLRSFSSGCTALTGIEAISSSVTEFQEPTRKNAKITLAWMALILAIFFLSITGLAHVFGIMPKPGETILSSLAHTVFGSSGYYYLFQISTALILIFAANTSYSGFPRLASLLAKERFLPRQLASLGDRLVFSNGILGLSIAAIILVHIFKAETHLLIPLYAVGVFISFTLSQFGMVMYHWKEQEHGWINSIVINLTGAITTLVVLLIIALTKFSYGAWTVILFIPLMMYLFDRINNHYKLTGQELSLVNLKAPPRLMPLKHTVIVPISGIHKGVIEALRYAISISDDVRACYVEIDPEITARVKDEWNKWAHEIPFIVLKSPYRSIIQPLLDYIDDVDQITHDEMITILIPEFVTAKWWHHILHNQTAFLIRASLLFRPRRVVTSVRYHLRDT